MEIILTDDERNKLMFKELNVSVKVEHELKVQV